MAIYHFSAQTIGRTGGRSATGAAAYRAGEVVIDERTEEVHDYSRKSGVVDSQIFAPTDAPAWVHNRSDLWNKVEKTEKRKDSQLCREINIALPAELSSRQRMDLIHDYVKRNFVSAGMIADVCIHAPSRTENNRNHHAHVMLTMRRLAGDVFGPKERSWNAVELLESWRKKWADAANAALEKAGFEDRIDHRSHTARGIEDEPSQHHGPAVVGILARGEHSDVAERQAGESAARAAAKLAAQLAIARAQATAAFEELAAAEAAAQAAAREQQALAQVQAEVVAQALAHEQAAAAERAQVAEAEALALAREQQAEAERSDAATQARAQHAAAKLTLAQAVHAHAQAEAQVEALQYARDTALDGQRQAGTSLFKTAQAAFKVPGWIRAIDAYDSAKAVLKTASQAVDRARLAVAALWVKILQLDPVERTRQATAQAAQAEVSRQEEQRRAEALAKRQAERWAVPGQWPARLKEPPLYEHSSELDHDRDKDRDRSG